MAVTPNYGWVLADVGGSDGAWGTVLNTLFTAIDATVKTISDIASAALPKSGGTMSGRLDLKTASMARQDKGSVSGATAFDLAVAQYFTMTVGGALVMTFTNPPTGTIASAVLFRITNGGSAAITWPAGTKWASALAPVLTVAGVDLVALITDDNGATWRGVVLAKDVR